MMTTCVSGLLATMLLSPPLSRCRTVTFEHQATEADEVTVYYTGNVDDSGTLTEGLGTSPGGATGMANSRRGTAVEELRVEQTRDGATAAVALAGFL
jgi:hypothetical protein